jgi:hypothetical protein
MGDFYLDVGLQVATLGGGRLCGTDETARMVMNALGTSLDTLLGTGEALRWDDY